MTNKEFQNKPVNELKKILKLLRQICHYNIQTKQIINNDWFGIVFYSSFKFVLIAYSFH